MPQDEERRWNKGIFGDKDSETLQHTMFYYNCKLFGLRGHHELECSQFVLGTNNSGKCVEFIGRASKTYKGGLAQMQLTNKRIRHHSSAGSPPKYGNQLVGVNKLKSMMKVICKKAGLEGNYSHHSGKRTCVKQSYMAGVD
uniref:Uncharacterized protein n=1 Tax=Magallana gigas TaxID=29159 RepID=K1Q4B5_MAGGI